MRSITALGLAAVFGLALGCGQQATTQAPDSATDEAATAPAAVEPAAVEMVEVAAEGTEFEPPVEVAQIPDGAWYCNMGTVHYARMDEGDGKCGVCGMNLTHKVAAAEPSDEPMTDENMGDDEGTEHQG